MTLMQCLQGGQIPPTHAAHAHAAKPGWSFVSRACTSERRVGKKVNGSFVIRSGLFPSLLFL